MGKIRINFGSIVSEMEKMQVNLCFLVNGISLFLEDKNKDMYQIEPFWAGSHLETLIADGISLDFVKLDRSTSRNIKEWQKESWDTERVIDFINRR